MVLIIREVITESQTWKHFQQFNISRVPSQDPEQTESQIYSDAIQMKDKSSLKIPDHAFVSLEMSQVLFTYICL